MSEIFKNVPQDIEEQILKLPCDNIDVAYRAVIFTDPLSPNDFRPSFDEGVIIENIKGMKQKGEMAETIALQSKCFGISQYSVSLSENFEAIKHAFFKNKKYYNGVAKGFCNKNKGIAHSDRGSHISFYLYDYENPDLNPYNDFTIFWKYE